MPSASAAKPNQSNLSFVVRRALLHEGQQAEGRDQPERHVHQKHPVPGILVGQQGAERRSHDRPHHDAHAEDRLRLRPLMRGIEIDHHRLRQRDQCSACGALNQAEDHQLGQILRQAAQDRGDRECRGAGHEQPLAAITRRHPADRRGHDRGGDDVGGQHPVDLVERGRQRALHERQRHIGDGRIQRLHHRTRHRASDDDGPPQSRLVRRCGAEAHLDVSCAGAESPSRAESERLRPVSTET